MTDKELEKILAKSIQLSNEFICDQSEHIYKHYRLYNVDYNIQIIINFFYSIIETTDGIYSLTFDKNAGSINALSRIQYESVIQFLTMLDHNYRENILSYEYHQVKDIINKNNYLMSVSNKFKSNKFKQEQEKLRNYLNSTKFEKIRQKIPKDLKYTNWFIVTRGKPKTINQLIKKYFETTQLLDNRVVTMYYSLLSGNIHNHNVDRLVQDGYLLPIRRDNLKDTSIDLVTMFMLASLIRLIEFLENELNMTITNKKEIISFFNEMNSNLKE